MTLYKGRFKDGQPYGYGTVTFFKKEEPPKETKVKKEIKEIKQLEAEEKVVATKEGNWYKGRLVKDYKGLSDEEIEACLDLIE